MEDRLLTFSLMDNRATSVSRQHVTTACIRCRLKKTKCPNEKPACRNCILANVECNYPPPRGRNASTTSKTRTNAAPQVLDTAESQPTSPPMLLQTGDVSPDDIEADTMSMHDPTTSPLCNTDEFPYTASLEATQLVGDDFFVDYTAELTKSIWDNYFTPDKDNIYSFESASSHATQSVRSHHHNDGCGRIDCGQMISEHLDQIFDSADNNNPLELLAILKEAIATAQRASTCLQCISVQNLLTLLLVLNAELVKQLQHIGNRIAMINISNLSTMQLTSYHVSSKQEAQCICIGLASVQTHSLSMVLQALMKTMEDNGISRNIRALQRFRAQMQDLNGQLQLSLQTYTAGA